MSQKPATEYPSLPAVVGGQFISGWLNMGELPGTMSTSPVPATTTALCTTSPMEAAMWEPRLEVIAADAVRQIIDAGRAARAARAEQDIQQLMNLLRSHRSCFQSKLAAYGTPDEYRHTVHYDASLVAIEAHARRMVGGV